MYIHRVVPSESFSFRIFSVASMASTRASRVSRSIARRVTAISCASTRALTIGSRSGLADRLSISATSRRRMSAAVRTCSPLPSAARAADMFRPFICSPLHRLGCPGLMDIHPDQWRRLTTSLGPPRLQLVQGLVQLSVQMRLEPDDLVEVQRMWEETGTRRREILPLRERGFLIGGHTSQAPEGQCDTLGQGQFDWPYGR